MLELGLQLAGIGFDALGQAAYDKENREKQLEQINEMNEYMSSRADSALGKGQGGYEMGHVEKKNAADYIIPALGQAAVATTAHIAGNWDPTKKLKKKPASSVDVKRPTESEDAETEPLPEQDVQVSASNNQQALFKALGYFSTNSPVGKTSQTDYMAGWDPELMKLFGKIALTAGTGGAGAALLKKGAKLIPRQTN